MRCGRQSNGETGKHDTSKDQPLGEIKHGPAPVPAIPYSFSRIQPRGAKLQIERIDKVHKMVLASSIFAEARCVAAGN
jgi:hypothetical protein